MEGVRSFFLFKNGLLKLLPARFRAVSKLEPCIGQSLEQAGQNGVVRNGKLGRLGSWEFCGF